MMLEPTVIDNLLPPSYANQIEFDLLQWNFPWYYVNDVTFKNYGTNGGLAHVAYDEGTPPSNWYSFIKPVVYHIADAVGKPIDKLLRIRVGFLTPSNQEAYSCNAPHVDFLIPHITACYYVSDSDGDTIVYDKKLADAGIPISNQRLIEYAEQTDFNAISKCTPVKNRVCVFDGMSFHSSTKPKQHDRRLVITINYVPQY